MKRRAASPAMSDYEVDIAGSLFANDADSDNEVQVQKQPADLDFGDLLDNGDSDDGGDAAFIAKQQRSSNRKTGNLQSKSAKKGGGFQAMGECRGSDMPGGLSHISDSN
jgi:ATP-dependent RNA helicase DDX54/DBP10